MRKSARLRPGLLEALIVAAPGVFLAWCLISDHEIACVVVALMMPIVVPVVRRQADSSYPDLTMGYMVGGTLGGLVGGILVRIFCAPASMMPIMMSSMAGMVGGTIAGWGSG